MDHISQCDWLSPRANTFQFVTETDLDNCVIEKILHNTFQDPLLSSESENENETDIDWDQIFSQNKWKQKLMKFVPGYHYLPPYPKLSSLSRSQQYTCLKVLCDNHPEILELEYMPEPSRIDFKIFSELKEKYEKEKEEYREWAKRLWANDHKLRVLRPHAIIETVYNAEFKDKAHEMGSFPRSFEMAAQISLMRENDDCEIEFDRELISVDIAQLPQIVCPDLKKKKFSVVDHCHMPVPCPKHPCRFVLPGEKSMSILPVLEVHRELAQYAAENDSQIITTETALKCLVELDKQWTLPITVSQVIGCDGEKCNVMVIGSEFTDVKQPAQTRTYRAFRHLLKSSLTTYVKIHHPENFEDSPKNPPKKLPQGFPNEVLVLDSSSDEEDNLFIDEGENLEIKTEDTECKQENVNDSDSMEDLTNRGLEEMNISTEHINSSIGSYQCTCKGTEFERPPPRSYRRWTIKDTVKNTKLNFIVHCAHKARDKEDEVILEPIPEYQLDLGGSEQSDDKIKALLLSLIFRRNACLLNVRIDAVTGETVTFEKCHYEKFVCTHGSARPAAVGALRCSLDRLHGLLPGHYLLRHEPQHGANAMLYVSRQVTSGATLQLRWTDAIACDEAAALRTAPLLSDALLPIHKYRKILPCAFTPFEYQVAKENKKRPVKTKVPPAAIKWPKKKRSKKKK